MKKLIIFTGLLIFALCGRLFAGSVVINEFVYDPDGSDEGYEWIELYNNTSSTIAITGWKIRKSDSVTGFEDFITISSPTKSFAIGPKSFFLMTQSKVHTICGWDAGYPDFIYSDELQMSNSSLQGICLTDGTDLEKDRVAYDDVAASDVYGEGGTSALDAGGGESLTRDPAGADSDNNAVDFYVNSFPTPKSSKYGSFRTESVCYSAPNPFMPTGSNSCKIISPENKGSLNAVVEIYDLGGMLVVKLTGTNEWDGRNSHGGIVSTGNYFIVYKALKGNAKGKMTIIR
ncbi:MAG: lamin tail domain-containing protein [Elusimicrobiota bacterium]|nr:lamin tail domain-containing protein [Elusimicrobiota bacterium]